MAKTQIPVGLNNQTENKIYIYYMYGPKLKKINTR